VSLPLQVAEVSENFARFLAEKVKNTGVYGGVSINPQMQRLFGTGYFLLGHSGRIIGLVHQKCLATLIKSKFWFWDEMEPKSSSMGFREGDDQILATYLFETPKYPLLSAR